MLKELRSWRIGASTENRGIAIFDVVMSIIGMIVLADYIGIRKITAVLLAVPIGVIFHYIFGIDTELNYFLGISNKPK